MPEVPFHRLHLTGTEETYITKALTSGHLRGDGPFGERCAAELKRLTGAGSVHLTPSCTHALELAAMLLDLGPGDEVVMPSFTFVSTANAVALRGAKPVFADIDPVTLNLDPASVAEAVTERTRAVTVVHYGGVAADMDGIGEAAAEVGAVVVEDAAHGLGGEHRGRALGSIGALGTLSFHDTKNVQCGEGGALLVNDPTFAERAAVLREKGTNRPSFLRGETDRYWWLEVGTSGLMSEVAAAMLVAQLGDLNEIQERRHRIWNTYSSELAGWAESCGAQLPDPTASAGHAAHLFFVLVPTRQDRDPFIDHLADRGVGAAFHYQPLHLTEPARRLGHRGALPVTEDVASRLVRLPLYPDLRPSEVERVLEAVTSYRP